MENHSIIANEEKYKSLFDNALEGIFIFSEDSSVVDANPAACKIYNIKKDEFLKLKVADIFPHKTKEESALIWKEFLRTGYLNGFYKFITHTGDIRYIDFKAKARFLPDLHLAVFSDVTEKTITERALRKSEATLRAIFNNSTQQIILLDLDYKIVTANEQAQAATQRLMGKGLEPGKSIFDYGRVNSAEIYEPIMQRVKKGETVTLEINLDYINKENWIEVVYIPVFYKPDLVQGICLQISDISYRKKTEMSLAESEARFKSLVQNSSDIITVLSPDSSIKYTSSSIEKILGYSSEKILGKNIESYIHEEDRQEVRKFLKKVYKDSDYQSVIEYRFLHSEGYYINMETACSNLLEDPYIEGLVLNSRDVTERKFQEESLLLLDNAIDSSKNGIIITDPNQPDNPIIYANKAFEQITGYKYVDLIGKNCRYLQGEDRDQPEVAQIRKAVQEQNEVSVILRNYRKDGTLFWNELNISPVFNRSGQLTNFIGVLNDITERKLSEETLLEITKGISGAEGHDFFRSLARHLAISFDADYVVMGEQREGKLKTQIYYKNGIFNPDAEYDLQNSPWKEIMAQPKCSHLTDIHLNFPEEKMAGAKDKTFACIGGPLIDSSGRKIGLIAVMRKDEFTNPSIAESMISIFSVRAAAELERDHNLSALVGSEKKFRDLAENSPDLIYIIDLEQSRVVYFNRNFFFDYETRELRFSEAWINLVHPEDINQVKKHWKEFLRSSGKESTSIEYRVRKKDGMFEWVINRHTVLERNSDGRIRSVLLNITVITNRKRAEEDLRENQARLSALIENTTDIVWSVDRNLSFTAMNASFRFFMNLNYKKVVQPGDKLHEVLPSEIKEDWLTDHHRALSGERFTLEFSPSLNNNLSYEISYNPIYSEEGIISGVSVFARDISERKKAENDIIRTNFELDSFVYRASHDLRAPLRSVLGLINLVKTENDELQRALYLKLVDQSINKLDNFISDLTDFSRNTRLEINEEKINFQNVLNECVQNLKYMDNAEVIRVESDINNKEDFYSDPKRISIIFHNIISNAIKYQNLRKEKSYVKVQVKTSKEMAKIIISDNGKGIREEYLDKIFNMFFRASVDSYGSGLGLYITKQVVEKLSGSIKVQSQIGEGTSFSIELPNLIK